jgi:hypothetical protein
MPPTSPQPGFPRIAVVMARLIINERDKGIRPFLVWLNDGYRMCKGVFVKYGSRSQSYIFTSNIPLLSAGSFPAELGANPSITALQYSIMSVFPALPSLDLYPSKQMEKQTFIL